MFQLSLYHKMLYMYQQSNNKKIQQWNFALVIIILPIFTFGKKKDWKSLLTRNLDTLNLARVREFPCRQKRIYQRDVKKKDRELIGNPSQCLM